MMKRLWIVMAVSAVLLSGCSASDETNGATAAAGTSQRPVIGAEVAVSGGTVHGQVAEDGLKSWHGIPFAAPPVGELRWAPPAPVIPWQGVRDATAAGPACMQPQGQGGSFYGSSGFEMDEDCLFLNVWTRAEHAGDQLPVMVWVHGGGLVTGSGSNYGGELLTSKGVVLVTINYRLGRFGFLAHPELTGESARGVSGNQGLRDQLAALHWVQDNIEAFGGDPGQVTIFGESAGSLSMSLLQASPLAKDLIHGVIGQSGGAFQPMWFRATETAYAPSAEAAGEEFVAALAGDGEAGDLAAARAVPQEQVLEVFQSNPQFGNYDSLAIVDGEVIPDEVATIFAEGRQLDVPVLIGSNADEGTTFLEFFTPQFGPGKAGFDGYAAVTLPEVVDAVPAVYPASDDLQAEAAWANMFSDVLFAYPMRVWARSMEAVESNAYLYFFTWAPPVENSEKYGAFHAGELGYIFGDLTLFGAKPQAEDEALSELMSSIWAQFAKTGNPNGSGLPAWQAYSADLENYMELGVNIGMHANLRMAQMNLVESAWQLRRGAQQ